MKRLAIIVICLFMLGCATKLVILEHDAAGRVVRTIDAEDYSIKTPTITAVPSRWLTPDFVGELIKGALGYFSLSSLKPTNVIPIPSPVTPQPTPQPAPVTPYPAPVPTPIPAPAPVVGDMAFSKTGNVLTLDMGTLPANMRKAGFAGSDNGLYYAMAHIYAYGPGKDMVSHPELNALNQQREAIYQWFDNEVAKAGKMLKAIPTLTLVAISNDGKDRCGFRLGPPICERLKEFGGRVTLGQILPPEQY
jgi:hypothetical protein